jgi:16S rRNA (guanine(966)-N(2))-methyltransferase RsmD
VRIISGLAKGKRLASFTGGAIRPTPDRVREAIFSILYSRFGTLEGKTVLDLFAGTGAMGLEALSRGCRRAVLLDEGRQSAAIIPANLKTCGLEESATYLRSDVLKALPRLEGEGPFDLIFLDPPYGRDLVPEVVRAISERKLLAPGGLVCAESAGGDEVPVALGDLIRIERRCYGSTTVHLFTHPEPEA